MKKEVKVLTTALVLGSSLLSAESSIIADAKAKMDTISVDLQKGHFYVGGGMSYQTLSNGTTQEKFTTFGKNIVVGYQYGDYMALEIRYSADVGPIDYDSGNIGVGDNDNYSTNFTNIGAYLKGIYPLGDISVYGLMGYGQVEITNVPEGNIGQLVKSIQFGGGISYRLYDKIILFADYVILYDDTGFDNIAKNDTISADLLTAGFTYKF